MDADKSILTQQFSHLQVKKKYSLHQLPEDGLIPKPSSQKSINHSHHRSIIFLWKIDTSFYSNQYLEPSYTSYQSTHFIMDADESILAQQFSRLQVKKKYSLDQLPEDGLIPKTSSQKPINDSRHRSIIFLWKIDTSSYSNQYLESFYTSYQ